MATRLLNPVRRETLANDRPKLIVSLEPGDIIAFRQKGKRTTYEVSVHQCQVLAMNQFRAEQYSKDMKAYKEGRRKRKPKAPQFHFFSRSIRAALGER